VTPRGYNITVFACLGRQGSVKADAVQFMQLSLTSALVHEWLGISAWTAAQLDFNSAEYREMRQATFRVPLSSMRNYSNQPYPGLSRFSISLWGTGTTNQLFSRCRLVSHVLAAAFSCVFRVQYLCGNQVIPSS
jgi:hypothetical protein